MNLSTVFSLGGAAIGLLSGGKSPLVIGGVTLDGMNSPEKMPWGGEQKVTTHYLPGGRMVFDLMGAYDRPMEMTGILDGARAKATARRLEAMMKAGKPVLLTCSDFKRKVIVSLFEPEYAEMGWRIPFKMTLLVVPSKFAADKPGFLERLQKDITDALGLDKIAPELAVAQEYIGYAKQALPFVGAISPALGAKLGGFLQVGGNALSGVQTVAEGSLSGFASVASAAGGLVGGSSAASMASRVTAATASAQALAASVAASSYAGRAAKSVAVAPVS